MTKSLSAVRTYLSPFVSLAAILVCSCSSNTDNADQSSSSAVTSGSGRWRLPAEVAAAGARVHVRYDDAPEWDESQCGHGLLSGPKKLARYLQQHFGEEISEVEGYACRPNTADTSQMSVHGTGRALDIMIPTRGGDADNTKGDRVANWLVVNAQKIGVQLIIWDRTIWRANGTNDGAYGGPHPHNDHVHAELNEEASAERTEWFKSGGASEGGEVGAPEGEEDAAGGVEGDEEYEGASEDEDADEYGDDEGA